MEKVEEEGRSSRVQLFEATIDSLFLLSFLLFFFPPIDKTMVVNREIPLQLSTTSN